MESSKAVNKLVEEGKKLFRAKKRFVKFTNELKADQLLNNLDNYPHAFVLACIMDRQIKAEKAWLIPYLIKQKLGKFEFSALLKLSKEDVYDLMTNPKPLHRFVKDMSSYLYYGIKLIHEKYNDDASIIWNDNPSSAEVVYRFLEFNGVGPKIATMATNILARDFKIPFADYYAIDISADVHIKRVLSRIGITKKDDTNEALIFKIKALYPEFPGLLDLPLWKIGRNWCHPKNTMCRKCYMKELCASSTI